MSRKQMESLEERLRSLEDLIKSSVAARNPDTTNDGTDVLTPSSMPSTTFVEPDLLGAEVVADDGTKTSTSRRNSPTLLQTLNMSLPVSSTSNFQLGEDLPPSWSPSEIDLHFDMIGMAAPALASTDEEIMPKVRYKGTTRCSMPPVQGGMFLLQEFLSDFNATIPIFDPIVIAALFEACYENMTAGLPIEWVALKIVLGIAHRLRAMSPLGVPQDLDNAHTYLQECLDTVSHLLMLRPSLLLAQCYIGIAILVSTSSRPYPAQGFVVLALRVMQDLHVNDPKGPQLTHSLELPQQRRVFWIAYLMDADMAMRAGRLPSLSPRLVNVELPSDDDPAGQIIADGAGFKANNLRLHVELALLAAEYMEQVLLPQAARHSSCPADAALQSINTRLAAWRRNWLFEIDPPELARALHRSDLVHVVVLESNYFSAAYTFISHLPPTVKDNTNPFSVEGLMAGISKRKAELLYKDARRFIDLLRLIPPGDVACYWLSLEALVSALVVVLAHIIFNPSHESSHVDLTVSQHMGQILHELSSISKDNGLLAVQSVCVNLYLKAETSLAEQQLVLS